MPIDLIGSRDAFFGAYLGPNYLLFIYSDRYDYEAEGPIGARGSWLRSREN